MNKKKENRTTKLKRNRLANSLKKNWPLRVLSIFMAVGLYIYVQVSLEVERVIRVPIIVPELPGDLVFSEKMPGFLNVALLGQANDLDFDVSRYRVFLDFENLLIGENEFQMRLRPEIPDGVKVRYRRSLNMKIEQAFQRELPVIPIVQLNQNQGEPEIQKVYYMVTPPTVSVYGSYAALKKLDRLATKTVYFSGRSLPTQKQATLAILPDQVFISQTQKFSVHAFALTEEKEIGGVQRPKVVKLDAKSILCVNPITNLSMNVNSDAEVLVYLKQDLPIPNVWIQCPVFTDREGSILPSAEIRNLPVFVGAKILPDVLFLEPQTVDVSFQLINPL